MKPFSLHVQLAISIYELNKKISAKIHASALNSFRKNNKVRPIKAIFNNLEDKKTENPVTFDIREIKTG